MRVLHAHVAQRGGELQHVFRVGAARPVAAPDLAGDVGQRRGAEPVGIVRVGEIDETRYRRIAGFP